MDRYVELPPISLVPFVVVVAAAGAAFAYYFRRRPLAIVLALIALAAIAYAVLWTFSPD